VRVHIPVGVAYGSDVPLVIKSLLEVAGNHPEVMKDPPPKVWFSEFGDSSLNFELLVWTLDPKKRPDVLSELNRAIDDIFRKNKIEIPFPQTDLHVRSSVPIEASSRNRNGSNRGT
jgi:small-conductance mechanosensitive channel